MVVSVKAYAKINLFLDVTAKRSDGYHDILSIMQSVSLHDVITVEYEKADYKKISIICDTDSVPCDERNLAYKAADILLENGCVTVTIDKQIPSEAGLAGGSADAAATLVAINNILGNKYSIDELKAIGKRLGADVPFCIEGGSCIIEGIGDVMRKCSPMPRCHIVIARMGEGMSTPYAYRKLDCIFNNFEDYSPKREKLDVLLSGSGTTSLTDYSKGFFNIFEEAVEPERPCVSSIKEIMLGCGARGAMMSGSGTSVFGIYESENDAIRANNALLDIGAISHICYPIN